MKSTNPYISIVTATYNAAKLLPKTMESIRRQSFREIEWIVIDGGSDDGTLSILNQFQSDLDFLWISEPDAGIYDAWNKGVAHSRGEWIGFLGAGDTLHKNALKIYKERIFTEAIRPDLVCSKINLINKEGEIKRTKGGPHRFQDLKRGQMIAHPCALHHKSLFEKHGLFDIRFSLSGDYEFLWRCGLDIKSIFLDAITVNMLIGGASDSYKGIFETFCIQKKYGTSLPYATWQYVLACAKRLVRPVFRGY